ncbi:MAG: VWA domain-containing protein [Candidatus Acidiferrales bacterium]
MPSGNTAQAGSLQRPLSGSQQPLQSTAELVKVEVSVADWHGNFAAGLTQKDFRILDDGIEQPATFFAPVETPARILVMIETGPAVYLVQNDHLTAAYALLEGLAPEDQVALVSYDRQLHQVLPFTRDRAVLLGALGGVQYNIGMGDLNFYDSLSTVVDWLKPVTGKRALVLLTTGLDSSAPARWDVLVDKLRREDIVIFPVALGGSLRGYSGEKPKRDGVAPSGHGTVSFANADRALRSLATISGGRAYFPESGSDFQPMYREIASALRHQYVLGFAPAHDGLYHSLSVKVIAESTRPARAHQSEYHVLARQGYVAPSQEAAPVQ